MTKAHVYAGGLSLLASGGTNLDTDVLGVALLTSSYALDAAALDSHLTVSQLTGELATASYARVALTNPTLTSVDDTVAAPGNVVMLSDVPPTTTFPALTGVCRYAVLYRHGAAGSTFAALPGSNDTSARLIQIIDFEVDQSPAGVDFVMTWTDAGILRLKAVEPDSLLAG